MSIKPGDTLRYSDGGEVYLVKVLENNSDDTWERYKLEVLKVERMPTFLVPTQVGDVFSCDKKRSSPGFNYMMWSLNET